jgi:hypothetical protein
VFDPQHLTAPSGVTPQVWKPPALALTKFDDEPVASTIASGAVMIANKMPITNRSRIAPRG